MKQRLYIVEGLPCSGKSTVSAYVARILETYGRVSFIDEGTGNHPADYEYHALAPAGLLSEREEVVSLSRLSAQTVERLLPYKIYDALPWETEMPLMLDKWRQFAHEAEKDMVFVFNCVLLQNPMCETMMRFGFDETVSYRYIEGIVQIIKAFEPVILYLKNDDIAQAVLRTARERPGWLESVIDYHVNGVYGKSICAQGFEGYISCLEERQRRELAILSKLPIVSFVLDNPQRNWEKAEKAIRRFIEEIWE